MESIWRHVLFLTKIYKRLAVRECLYRVSGPKINAAFSLADLIKAQSSLSGLSPLSSFFLNQNGPAVLLEKK